MNKILNFFYFSNKLYEKNRKTTPRYTGNKKNRP